MKKLLLMAAVAVFSISGFAQTGEKSVLVKGGYQTEFERFGLGVEGRYGLTDNFRVAPDVIFLIPNNHTTGLYVNANLHYTFPLQDNLTLYPLAGIAMANNRVSFAGESWRDTDFGLNLGAGVDYNLDSNSYVNVEFRYTFIDPDYALFTVGYGIKF